MTWSAWSAAQYSAAWSSTAQFRMVRSCRLKLSTVPLNLWGDSESHAARILYLGGTPLACYCWPWIFSGSMDKAE